MPNQENQECNENSSNVSNKLIKQGMDPRYPFRNQTKACYDNYCDYYKCQRLMGKTANSKCIVYKIYYEAICPKLWTDHWDELRKNNDFPSYS